MCHSVASASRRKRRERPPFTPYLHEATSNTTRRKAKHHLHAQTQGTLTHRPTSDPVLTWSNFQDDVLYSRSSVFVFSYSDVCVISTNTFCQPGGWRLYTCSSCMWGSRGCLWAVTRLPIHQRRWRVHGLLHGHSRRKGRLCWSTNRGTCPLWNLIVQVCSETFELIKLVAVCAKKLIRYTFERSVSFAAVAANLPACGFNARSFGAARSYIYRWQQLPSTPLWSLSDRLPNPSSVQAGPQEPLGCNVFLETLLEFRGRVRNHFLKGRGGKRLLLFFFSLGGGAENNH